MRRRCKIIPFLSWLILCCALHAAGQSATGDSTLYHAAAVPVSLGGTDTSSPEPAIVYNTAQPDAAEWQQATGSDAYGYRDKREYTRKTEPPEKIPGWYKLLVRFADFLGSPAGKAVLWIVLALIVGYVAYRIIAGQGSALFGRRDRKKSAEDNAGNISEEGLLQSDWEERLRAALAAGDARLAVRYSYMHILQALQERGLIAYRPDKTNAAYYRELTESLRQPFRTISQQYEYAWYGGFLPEPAVLESYMQTYDGLKKSITYA